MTTTSTATATGPTPTGSLESTIKAKIDGALDKAAGELGDNIASRIKPSLVRQIAPYAAGAVAGVLATVWINSAGGPYVTQKRYDDLVKTANDERAASQVTIEELQKIAKGEAAKPPVMMPGMLRGRDVMTTINPRSADRVNNQVLEGPMPYVSSINSEDELKRQLSRIGAESLLPNPLNVTVHASDNRWLLTDAEGKAHLHPHGFSVPEVNLHTAARQARVAEGLKYAEADSRDPAYAGTRITYRFVLRAAEAAKDGNPAVTEATLVRRDIGSDDKTIDDPGTETILTLEAK
jgi:hypothetical protein